MKKKYYSPTFKVVKIKYTHRFLLASGLEKKGSKYYRDEYEDPENAI